MRIIYLSPNEEAYNYEAFPRGDVALVYFLRKFGHEVLILKKWEMLKFYYSYLKFKPDIVISYWVPSGFFPAFFKKLGLVKCPIVHGWEDYYSEAMTNYPFFLVDFLEKFTIKNSDHITTSSKYNESKAKQIGKPASYIPWGVDLQREKTNINLDNLKTNLKNLKIIYLGDQFSKFKRVDKIITAVEGLKCDLFLLGDTNPELTKLAGKNVHFMGNVPGSQVFLILKQADILVNTSNMDNNFKFFEYIRVGKPILANDGRPSYIFKHKEDAYLTDNFHEGLKELIDNPKLRKKLEKNIKKIRIMTWKEYSKVHEKLFKKIIDNNL